MFDAKWATRLLRMDWPDPPTLARELYSMLTSKEARTIGATLRVSVPPGESGLVIGRSDARSVDAPVSALASVRQQRIEEAARNSVAPQRTDASFGSPEAAFEPFPSRPPSPAFDDSSSASSSLSTSSFPGSDLSGGPRQPPPQSRRPEISSAQVQVGLGDSNQARAQSASLELRSAKPYQSPVFEVQGEARFTGINPVQFDVAPRVYNPKTDSYEPYDFDGSLTRIPLETANLSAWFGKVVLSAGTTALCELHATPSPDDVATSIVSVTLDNEMSPDERIPKDTYIYPVVQDDKGNWWGQVPLWS